MSENDLKRAFQKVESGNPKEVKRLKVKKETKPLYSEQELALRNSSKNKDDDSESEDQASDVEEDEEYGSDEEGEESEAEETGQAKSNKALSFATAMQRILDKPDNTKTKTKKVPILSRNTIEQRIDEKKLEAKALKLLSKEKKVRKAQDRVKCPGAGDAVAIEFEKKLRKLATRGVVKLFNAIREAQSSSEKVLEGTILQKAALVPIVTKQTFLNAIQKKNESLNEEKKSTDEKNSFALPKTTLDTAADATASPAAPVSWLSSDYLLEKKTKHWDESSDEEQ